MAVNPFLSVRDVAEILHLSVPRIYQLVNAHKIPSTRVGRSILIPRAAFDAWVQDQTDRALASVGLIEYEDST